MSANFEETLQRAAAAGQEFIVVDLNFGVARLLAHIGALHELRETAHFATRRKAVHEAHRIVSAWRESGT